MGWLCAQPEGLGVAASHVSTERRGAPIMVALRADRRFFAALRMTLVGQRGLADLLTRDVTTGLLPTCRDLLFLQHRGGGFVVGDALAEFAQLVVAGGL